MNHTVYQKICLNKTTFRNGYQFLISFSVIIGDFWGILLFRDGTPVVIISL